MDKTNKALTWAVELIVVPAVLLAFYRWGDQLGWEFSNISALQVFPLLGLLAFTIMWWHFFVGFMIQMFSGVEKMIKWHRVSGYLVFALILLHPILLGTQIWGDGLTFFDYVGPQQKVFIALGLLALAAFLLYDLARWLRERDWVKNNWHIIDAIDDAAFVAIFIHAINLGSHLQSGWLRGVWMFYGFSAIVFILAKHYQKITQSSSKTS